MISIQYTGREPVSVIYFTVFATSQTSTLHNKNIVFTEASLRKNFICIGIFMQSAWLCENADGALSPGVGWDGGTVQSYVFDDVVYVCQR